MSYTAAKFPKFAEKSENVETSTRLEKDMS